nr:carboxypeptidase regulatory-like domain-containing protein [bacterium]
MRSVSTIVFCLGLVAGLAFWGCSSEDSPSGPESTAEYGDITGKVYGTDGDPIEGANVSAGGVSVLTDLDGAYTLTDVPVGDHVLSASSNGLTTSHRNLDLVADETLHASDMVLAELETVVLDGATGGTATTSDGVCSVEFGADAFVAAGEKAYTGDVTVQINAFLPVDDDFPAVFPGYFEGVREDGTTTMFASYGFVTVNLASADKAPLNLAPGATAHLSLDIGEDKAQDAPPTPPLWDSDEDEG